MARQGSTEGDPSCTPVGVFVPGLREALMPHGHHSPYPCRARAWSGRRPAHHPAGRLSATPRRRGASTPCRSTGSRLDLARHLPDRRAWRGGPDQARPDLRLLRGGRRGGAHLVAGAGGRRTEGTLRRIEPRTNSDRVHRRDGCRLGRLRDDRARLSAGRLCRPQSQGRWPRRNALSARGRRTVPHRARRLGAPRVGKASRVSARRCSRVTDMRASPSATSRTKGFRSRRAGGDPARVLRARAGVARRPTVRARRSSGDHRSLARG